MRTLRLMLCCLLVLTAGIALQAQAQFQGTITFESFEIEEDGRTAPDTFTLYVTPERILLQGESSYDSYMPFETEGVLVRLDFEDFVFLTGDDRALTISKADITSFMNMFSDESSGGSGYSGSSGEEVQINYERTGETRQVNGYTCEKFVLRDADDRRRHTAIWMTDELDINWGMLAEPWMDDNQLMAEGDFPVSAIFGEGYFPLLIENFRNGERVAVTEASRISRSAVARAMVEIPSGVQVLSLQDYLFQSMSGN